MKSLKNGEVSGVPLLNFEGGPGDSQLNSRGEGGPGFRVPGSWS